MQTVLKATMQGTIFELKEDLGGYRWFFPDGTRSDIWRETVEEARRAMAYAAGLLLAQWREMPGYRTAMMPRAV